MSLSEEKITAIAESTEFVEQRRRKQRRASENRMKIEAVSGIEGKTEPDVSIEKAGNVQREPERKIYVPADRFIPLKENWLKIYKPVVENLQLQISFIVKTRYIELRTTPETPDIANLQKAADFVNAFVDGFEVEDALALINLNDMYVETFEIQDVKRLRGDHLSRAIGRLVGKGGITKFAIEDITDTRIVLVDYKVHILGSYQKIQFARRAVCNLILGRSGSKVCEQLKYIVSKVSDRL